MCACRDVEADARRNLGRCGSLKAYGVIVDEVGGDWSDILCHATILISFGIEESIQVDVIVVLVRGNESMIGGLLQGKY